MKKNTQKNQQAFAYIEKFLIFTIIFIGISIFACNVWQKVAQETNNELNILDSTIQVRNEQSGLFGNIRILTEDSLTLEFAHVRINNIPFGDFADKEILLRVYPGDIISIDGSAYKRALSFSITATSSNISPDYLKATVITNGDIADAGIIVFK